MSPIFISLGAFGCIFGGALVGLMIQRMLPDHHLKPESKDAVKLGAGLIATMAALVLGILVGAAKSSFDSVTTSVIQGGTKFILLDRVLAQYGPPASEWRGQLRDMVEEVERNTCEERSLLNSQEPAMKESVSLSLEGLSEKIRSLTPETNSQKFLQIQAVQLANEIVQYRWQIFEQEGSVLPPIFLIILVFWLTALNLTYGLFAPCNGTVIAVLMTCAFTVAAALFLIMEMNRPLQGFVRVSGEPFRKTLEHLGR